MRTDAELLEAWRAGDGRAGRELFLRHFECVNRFFRGKIGHEREDLIQRTFLACVEARDRIRGGEKFRPYLLCVARSKLYDHYAKHARSGRRLEPLHTSLVDLGISPSHVIAERQRDQALVLALRKLPLDLQIAIELHYWEGLTMRELGRVLGVPDGTAKTRLFRARSLLREELRRTEGISEISDDDLGKWARALREIADNDGLLEQAPISGTSP